MIKFLQAFNHSVLSSNVVNYLGVILDNFFNEHALNAVKMANTRLSFLHRQASFLNQRWRELSCQAPIQCLFEYCSSSWYNGLSKTLKTVKKKLQVIQNKMVRLILMHDSRFYDGQISSHGMLSSESRAKFLRLNHTYDIFYNCSSPYVTVSSIKRFTVHNKDTRFSPF